MGFKARKTIAVPGTTAVLSALDAGVETVVDIAAGTRMTPAAVRGAISDLRNKGRIKRTNPRAKGIGVVATYKITGKGSTALRQAKKVM